MKLMIGAGLATYLCLVCPAVLAMTAERTEPQDPVRIGLLALEREAERIDGASPGITVEIDEELAGESFSTNLDGKNLLIRGGDATGLMYGLLDIAEQLRNGGSWQAVRLKSESPQFPFRAIKFNLPWFAYRSNDAITLHHERCRDLAFWEAFLDMMAENRFNVLSLWNLHPWPYLVRLENFPWANSHSDEELAEWQNLYREIFRMARERGIDTYLVNWNIFVSRGFAEHFGLRGVGNISKARGYSDEIVKLAKQYNREAVTRVLNEFPNLSGIGVSLGEAMGGMSAVEREQWIQDVYVKGIQDADRPAKFIHRLPFSAGLSNGGTVSVPTEQLTRNALESIEGITTPIWTEAKFNWSHGHSTPKLVKVHGGLLTDTYWNPAPTNYRMNWMVRNEDFFFLRWGNPAFIREHIRQNGGDHVGGYYVGSETYIPAVDYFTKNLEGRNWEHAFERQWLFYKLWGRLLYNPGTPDAVFAAEFRHRYGIDGERMLAAMSVASRFPLLFTSLVDINNDKSFYAEGFLARDGADASRFLDLELLLTKDTLDPDLMSARDYAVAEFRGEAIPEGITTPPQVAITLEQNADLALSLIDGFDPAGSEALRQELVDIQAWSHLSRYLADKLRAAVELQKYRESRYNHPDSGHKLAATQHILDAIAHWETLVDITQSVYRIAPLTHFHKENQNVFHWSLMLDEVRGDLDVIDRDQFGRFRGN